MAKISKQRLDSQNIGCAAAYATALIGNCERDLRRSLSRGECNDLLLDNTRWTRSEVVSVMDTVGMKGA